jgi:SET domain-containing protein
MSLEVRPSNIEGNGVFTTVPIKAGEIVERFQGEIIPTSQLAAIEERGLYHCSIAISETESLLVALFDPRQTEADVAVGSGVGGFNHSCDSNLWMRDAVTVEARRDIEAGEELTLDDALVSTEEWIQENCRCGTAVCRGTPTGRDWRLPEVQQRYAGHFSPFLNERIERNSPSPSTGRGPGGGV